MGLVQSATQVNVAASSATAATITLNGVTDGNAIIGYASIWSNNATWTLTNTTDGGNAYTTRQANATNASRAIAAVARSLNVTGGNRTLSFNTSGGAGTIYYVLGAEERSGLSVEDVQSAKSNQDTTTNDVNTTAITTTNAGDLIVGVATVSSSDATLNFSSPSSWTNAYRQNDSNTYIGMDAGYWQPGAIQSSYVAQWAHDNTAGDVGGGVIVAFMQAAVAAPLMKNIWV